MVEMQYVSSSNIEAVGYDVEAMELHVQFQSSSEPYIYMNVPEEVYQEFVSAPSLGSYLNRVLKGVYEFRR